MKKRIVNGIDVLSGSGNVFADLGLPDAEKLWFKTELAVGIARAVERLGLTQSQAAERMGIPQPKVSAILRGNFAHVSERKLIDCLTRLGYDVEVRVKSSRRPVGQLTVALAS